MVDPSLLVGEGDKISSPCVVQLLRNCRRMSCRAGCSAPEHNSVEQKPSSSTAPSSSTSPGFSLLPTDKKGHFQQPKDKVQKLFQIVISTTTRIIGICFPLNVEQALINICHYLNKTSKYQAAFEAFQILHELKDNKILQHVSKRGLSISGCLPRLLENWQPILDFSQCSEKMCKLLC
ncbi:hypothetical protein PoB_001985400 [Plakobranchus ocellatus]|uniref:Uncharacterized protein n=1 Tax=Plakobranchus ocellatus TaxID=259542 RepID=A0AAV3ZG55_9GAST|nr:hypothetical protein PoB_001985400 [Plakobranchus ocellatus]